VIPQQWTQRRLRFDARLNPVKSELNLEDDAEVSFVPMDAVGELGGLRLDEERTVDEVYNGYTYFRDGDVVVAKITPCFENGKGAISEGLTNGVGFGTTELHVARPGNGLDDRFLFYITLANDFRSFGEAEMLGAGGQKRVPERFLKDWQPPLPPLETQKRIAAFLDEKTTRIDGLIAKKQALLVRLAEKRQAIITQAVTKGLNPAAPMKDSGIDWLGQIPAHWEVLPFRRSIRRIDQGWSPQCEERQKADDEWGVLRSGCVNEGLFRPHDHKALPVDIDPRPELEVHVGDLLMCRASGSLHLIGSAAIVDACPPKLMFSDKTYRIMLHLDLADPDFVALALGTKYMREQIILSVSGAGGLANNIPQSLVRSYAFVRPPLVEQQEIVLQVVSALASLVQAAARITASVARLSEYRSALITAAVTGQIEGLR
jgi:type I restriction enzyme S subunit